MHATLNYVVAVACALFTPMTYAQSVKDNPGPSLVAAVANADDKSSPIYGVTIPAGYRQWELVAVSQETGRLDELRGILGNALSWCIRACEESTAPEMDGGKAAS